MDKNALTVFLPFYNEEDLVMDVVEGGYSFLSQMDRDFELLLVDDGSTDSTWEKINSLEEEREEIRAVKHEKNQGYGMALRTGFEEADNPLIFYMDGDGQFSIEEIEKLLEKEQDIVAGYRKNREEGFKRSAISRIFNVLARFLLPIEEKDIDCGFKLVRKDVIDDIELNTRRTVDAELLAKARDHGFTISQVPVEHLERDAGNSEASGLIGVRIGLILKSLEELMEIRSDIK